MKKTLNKDTGEVTFSFTDKEIKKLKSYPWQVRLFSS